MKIKTFLLCTTMCALMAACSSEDAATLSDNRDASRQTAETLLKEINRSNPLSSIGIMHNEELDGIMKRYSSLTRSNTEFSIICDSIRSQAISDYMATGDTLGISPSVFAVTYDSVALPSALTSHQMRFRSGYSPTAHGIELYACVAELDNIFEDNDNDLASLLSRLKDVQDMAGQITIENARNMVYLCVSVAANSLTYWNDVMNTPDHIKKDYKSWKDVAKADVSAGKAAHNLLGNSFWGWVGTAIIGGGASAIKYFW